MGMIDQRIADLGLVLPAPLVVPEGAVYPFPDVHVIGQRVLISGHGPQEADGSISGPFGRVGDVVAPEAAQGLARKTCLSMLSSLKRALGDLDRIAQWVKVLGMVNAVPDFHNHPKVINGFSFCVLDVFGPEVGAHARSAVGVSGLPENYAVEVEAEVMLKP